MTYNNQIKITKPDILPGQTADPVGPYFLIQKKSGHRLTQDTVLLCDFLTPLKESDTVIDLGTGSGAIPIILCWKSPAKKITGVEIDDSMAGLARRNIAVNGLDARVDIIREDIRDLRAICKEGSYSTVVSNPPYTKADCGRISPVKERALARSELMGGIGDIIKASAYLLKKDGRAFYVFPASRLDEMLEGLGANGLKAVRLRFIHTGGKKEARLFLVEAARGGTLRVEEPLFV